MGLVLLGRMKGSKDWEEIDTAKDADELEFLESEYSIAFGPDWEFDSMKSED